MKEKSDLSNKQKESTGHSLTYDSLEAKNVNERKPCLLYTSRCV